MPFQDGKPGIPGFYIEDGLTSLDTANTAPIQIPGDAVAFVYGAYIDFDASTSEDYFLSFIWTSFVGGAASGAIQIATGAAGSEVNKLTIQLASTIHDNLIPMNPLVFIPAGSRVSMRGAYSAGNKILVSSIHVIPAANLKELSI